MAIFRVGALIHLPRADLFQPANKGGKMVGSSLNHVVLAALVAASFTTAASAQESGGLPALSDRVAVLQQIVSTQQASLASLQTLVTTLQSALAAETQQRIAAQQALQAAIAQETTQRVAGDAALQSAIAQETTQRVAGDAALQSALNTEAGIRQSTDQALANSITENKIDVYFGAGSGGAIPDDDAFHELVSKTLPPGLYAVFASARIGQDFSNGDEIFATCELRNGAVVFDRVRASLYDAAFGDAFEYMMMATVSLPSGGSLSVLCKEAHDAPGVGGSARIMAIKVD